MKGAAFYVILMAALLAESDAAPAQDSAADKAVFGKCQACHAVGTGAKNKLGCVCRKSDSAILMVKAAKDRSRDDGAEELNRAMERGVLVQRSMSPRHIIIGGISA